MPKLTASALVSHFLASDTPYRPGLIKADRLAPAFTCGIATVSTAQAISVLLPSGAVLKIPSAAPVLIDFTLVPGTDYAIHALPNGGMVASASYVPPTGGALIGGFHFALGSNAYIPENSTTFYGDGPALVRSGNFQVSTGNFYFRVPSGVITYKASAALSLSAGTVPANTWAIYRFGIDSAGTITVYPGAANTTGYSTEALAIAALPAVPGTDRAIGYVTVRANAAASFTPGADALLGGAGGNVVQDTRYYSKSSMGPSINPYSIWDLNWRPTCPDPRGMACIGGKFWMDIYLTNNRPDLWGTSAANKTIADDSSRASRPVLIGGKTDGSLTFTSHNWWDSDLLAGAYGKSHPTLDEFQEAALGATQGVATIWDRATTSYYGALTSMCGLCQSFGQSWIWCTDAGDSADRKALVGGYWVDSGSAGSRYVYWGPVATASIISVSSRFRSDHLIA